MAVLAWRSMLHGLLQRSSKFNMHTQSKRCSRHHSSVSSSLDKISIALLGNYYLFKERKKKKTSKKFRYKYYTESNNNYWFKFNILVPEEAFTWLVLYILKYYSWLYNNAFIVFFRENQKAKIVILVKI